MRNVMNALYDIVQERKSCPTEGSYTSYLFEKGLDKILKKCGEECAELIISAKNGEKTEIINETADLFYHVMVLLSQCDINIDEVFAELEIRAEKQKNLKAMKKVDRNT